MWALDKREERGQVERSWGGNSHLLVAWSVPELSFMGEREQESQSHM